MKRVAIIDNYDSFTFNLVHLVDQIADDWRCFRNDQVDDQYLEEATHILLSPGPGIPSEAGRMPQVIESFQGRKSIMGVCLGFQAIAETLGSELYNLEEILHGVQTEIQVDSQSSLFASLPNTIRVGRYHSWAVRNSCNWTVTARDHGGVPMAAEDVERGLYGVQFHPESIMTEYGLEMLQNWLKSPSPRRL